MTTLVGGSEPTNPSFLRPQYVLYNSLSKSKDLGTVSAFSAILSGRVGSQAGAATLFFKITTRNAARIGIRKGDTGSNLDRYVRVGLSDGARNPLNLTSEGFGTGSSFGPDAGDDVPRLPSGTYYFIVASDRWQASPFDVEILVESLSNLQGAAELSAPLELRILPPLRLSGIASGINASSGSLRPADLIRPLGGIAGGELFTELSLAILRGTATLTMTPYARLRQDHRLEGIAGGTLLPVVTIRTSQMAGIASGSMPNIATISVRRASGYDY